MKLILTSDDLAINGAHPAFGQPLHVGRPNVGSREVFQKYTEEIFDRRWLSNGGPLVQAFEKRVADFLGVKHCISMCNGTVALEIATQTSQMLEPCAGTQLSRPYTRSSLATTMDAPL